MKRNILVVLIMMILIISVIPQMAMAATYSLDSSVANRIASDGVTVKIYGNYVRVWSYYDDNASSYYITEYIMSDGDTLAIGDDAKVRVAIGNTTSAAIEDFNIVCGSNITLKLESLAINSSNCALTFTGTGNTLVIDGSNTITSGYGDAGICVGEAAELSISGSGSLNVEGGTDGAGIGGSYAQSAGTISIADCTVYAYGGLHAPGIGCGGQDATIPVAIDGGIVTINSGYVYADGGTGAAGIGGGTQGDGGTVTINGGTVIADGSRAGIGGGDYESGGGGDGGTVEINGGVVFAYGYSGQDIGRGSKTNTALSEGTLEIGGKAIVFLENDLCPEPVTDAHTHIEYTAGTSLFGYDFPTKYWAGAATYAITAALVYDDNGGTGSQTIIAPKGSTQTIISGSGLSKAGCSFDTWNTAKDGAGNSYDTGDSLVMDSNTVLYAIWTENPTYTVSFDSQSGSAISDQTIEDGAYAIQPANPTRDGFVFGGWYTSSACNDGEQWNFSNYPITEDKILYAKWTYDPDGAVYTVQFDSQSGSAVADQTVYEGGYASKPSDPVRSNYSFDGWYTGSACNDDDRWNFSVCAVTEDVTLFAKWSTGISVTHIVAGNSYKAMQLGTSVSIDTICPYTVYPANASDASVNITSSNPSVASISGGMITAHAEGRTEITITASDTTNGTVTAKMMLEVMDSATAGSSINDTMITGTVVDSNGISISGMLVTTYSDPMDILTDGTTGGFAYSTVPYTQHIMVVSDDTGDEIGRFVLDFDYTGSQSISIDNAGNIASIGFAAFTDAVDFTVQVNDAYSDINIIASNITGDDIIMYPETGDSRTNTGSYALLAALCMGLLLFICKHKKGTRMA